MTQTRISLQDRKRFEPTEVEPRISAEWLASGLFSPEPEGDSQENYSIAIPPPNVTGSLHMGHALNCSIQDVLIRYHRMLGQRTKWILGTDHAGIATQTQVERALAAEGTTKEEIGREAFLARVWEWREHYGGRIVEQLQRLGASCDYEHERFTLDEGYARAVVRVFVALFERGYIYRDRYLVNWDPGSRSAISDLEVHEREVTDTLYSIRYDIEGGGEVTIATVRPETMLGDTAVAVHPDDERYRHLVGRTAILPLVGRRLPIIADEFVKPDFGTGQLKITPAHDANDFEIGQRHHLDKVSVIGEDGRMTADAGERFAGLTVFEAREAVVAALEGEGRIVAREEYVHEVPYSHRSGERIEPLISLQWFMRMDELAAPAIESVTSGRVRITPDNHRRVYLEWMRNIRPWCVSRQLWWGHRLPVYYCDECGETYVSETPPERCGACGGPVRQDEDVLDTWFSSALWPFATLGWPEQTPDLAAFYPTDVLSTARDILFLWVARMIMMGLEFTGRDPFSDVYVHSVIQAPDGRRMSKSLGTGIDPLEEIAAHGADAVRFGLLAMSSAQDVRYSAEKVRQGQALANKLFNAARFVLTHPRLEREGVPPPPPPTQGFRPEASERDTSLALEDRWILSRASRIASETAVRIDSFDFSKAALGLYDFVYGELCDWYLELAKPRLGEEATPQERRTASAVLLHVLRRTLAVAHPVIPFVTEELWAEAGGEGLLAGARYPAPEPERVDEQAERDMGRAFAAITALRAWRDSADVRPGAVLPARLNAPGYEPVAAAIARMARLDLAADGAAGEPVASVPIPGGTLDVLAAPGVDPGAARAGLQRKIAQLESEVARARAKLDNPGFVQKAPPPVVAAERDKLAELERELTQLREELDGPPGPGAP